MPRKPKSEPSNAAMKAPRRTKAGAGSQPSESTTPIRGARPRAAPKTRRKRPAPTTVAASHAPAEPPGAPLPHELLLAIARGERVGEHDPTFAERLSAAKASARYFAPERKADEGDRAIARDIKHARRTLAAKLARLAPDGGVVVEGKDAKPRESTARDRDK